MSQGIRDHKEVVTKKKKLRSNVLILYLCILCQILKRIAAKCAEVVRLAIPKREQNQKN